MRQIEVIEHTFCDVCMGRDGAQNNADEADAIKLTVNGRPRRLDVCPTHQNPTWNEITAYWTEDTGPQPVTVKRGAKEACPVCGKPAGIGPRGVLMHLGRMHKELPLGERQRLAGMPVTGPTKEPAKKATRRPRKAS